MALDYLGSLWRSTGGRESFDDYSGWMARFGP